MQANYMSMSNYGQGYQPLAPLALTQPEPIPSWMPASAAPVQRTFPMASAMPDSVTGNGAWLGDYADLAPALPNVTAPGGGSNWFRDSGFLSQKNADGTMSQGWGGLALSGAQALGSLYMGMKQYNLAKDTLAANKAQFERNFEAQKATTNAALEDRQRARVASNPTAYQSVGEYMNQNGVR